MSKRLTAEEKEERKAQRRSARELAKKIAKAKECGRYIIAYNQQQLDAALVLMQYPEGTCNVLELQHGVFHVPEGELPVDHWNIRHGAMVFFPEEPARNKWVVLPGGRE